MKPLALLLVLLLGAACRGGEARPAAVDVRNDVCRTCRMPVSDPKLAAELAAPGEEPLFFDDVACLNEYLGKSAALPAGAVAFVADHRTGAWVIAGKALFSRCPSIETPMGSHVIAHADDASRAADPSASGCAPVAATELFGPAGPPGGSKER